MIIDKNHILKLAELANITLAEEEIDSYISDVNNILDLVSQIEDIDTTDVDLTQSLKKGILTNLLNPNAYIFWLLIGGPLMATAADTEPIAPFAYAVSFILSIVIVKITLAYFFSKAQVNLSSDRYLLTLKICGCAMFIFAGSFLYKAYDLWQNGL